MRFSDSYLCSRHRDGDVLLELGFVEIADIRQELEGQELLHLPHLQLVLVEHHPDKDPDGGVKIVGSQHLDAVVVFLHGALPCHAQMALAPLAGLFAPLAEGPRPHEEDRVLLVRDAEEGEVEFKRSLHEEQRLLRGVVQQQLAELLPVELRVQRTAQTVIELVQPLKRRCHPPGGDVLGCRQLREHL